MPMQLEFSKCEVWLKEVGVGLHDIFFSKIDPRRRNLALQFSGVLSQVFGFEWAIQQDHKFLLLWLHLVVVVSLAGGVPVLCASHSLDRCLGG